MIKVTFTLATLAICNALLAVTIPWYLVTRLGVGVETDAFFASTALPQLTFLVVSFSVSNVLVPLLATASEMEFRRDSWTFFIGVSGVLFVLAVPFFVLTPYWVSLLVPGFSSNGKNLTVTLTRIQLLSMIGNGGVVVLWSAYFARQKFIWAELSSVLANAASLVLLISLLPMIGVYAAAWASAFNLGLKIALLIPLLGRLVCPNPRSANMREAWRRIKPFIALQTYSRIDPIVDRLLTSMTVAGSLSLLYISQQIYSVATIVLNKAMITPVVPALAIAAKAANVDTLKRAYRERLIWVAAIGFLTLVGLLALGEPLLHLMIGRGGITAGNVRLLWWMLIILLGSFVGGALGQVTSASFFAIGNTKTPTTIFILTFTIYLPVKIVMFLHYGLLGLAGAISIHLVSNFLIQLVTLERTLKQRYFVYDKSFEPSAPIKEPS